MRLSAVTMGRGCRCLPEGGASAYRHVGTGPWLRVPHHPPRRRACSTPLQACATCRRARSSSPSSCRWVGAGWFGVLIWRGRGRGGEERHCKPPTPHAQLHPILPTYLSAPPTRPAGQGHARPHAVGAFGATAAAHQGVWVWVLGEGGRTVVTLLRRSAEPAHSTEALKGTSRQGSGPQLGHAP